MCPPFSYGSCGFKCPSSIKSIIHFHTKYVQTISIIQGYRDNCYLFFNFTDNSDITVVCGTNRMELQILLCPLYFYGYNESMVALNGQFGKPECKGTADWTVNPPVMKFQFYITEPYISICANKLTEIGSGLFSDFSSVQSVNISGLVSTQDPNAGTITYRQEMKYLFSCRYPLQYLVNNTEMSDYTYTTRLFMPPTGLMLKTRVFVEVRATNLTERYFAQLETIISYVIHHEVTFVLWICNLDLQTIMGVNGEQQLARFSFETFRFVEHRNRTVSTFYLHCTTRLCESSFCRSLRQNCTTSGRKRRAVQSAQGTSVSDAATVSSGAIITKVDGKNSQLIYEIIIMVVNTKSRNYLFVAFPSLNLY
uniref:Si:ch73-261i21.5 n=1 Tax=Cyprinus carpio TaxID=7962 RepID=A0A8C2JHK3_CYPCA